MQELLEQNSYNKYTGEQEPSAFQVPEMTQEALEQVLQSLQGLEGDVATSQNKVQLNQQQEKILFDKLKNINDALWYVDNQLQVNDSWGGWIGGVRKTPAIVSPVTPMSGLFSKVAMHQASYKSTIVSKIQEIDKAFSLLNRDHFLGSNKNKGRWLELNKMYLEMVSGVGKTYNAIPKIIKDVKDRLTYANTILTQLPLTDVRWNKREKEQASKQKEKQKKTGVDAISGATLKEKNIIMTTDETLDDLEDKLRVSDVSYNDQALEKNIPYFKNLYQQIYQKIKSDSSLTPEQRKQKVLRLACIITGRSVVYHNWEKGAPKMSTTYGRETATTAYDYHYDWFRKEGSSSSGIHDKFMDPDFAQTILHTELLGAEDLSNQETVFSRIINNAGIPVEHKFNTLPNKLYEIYGSNPKRNLPNPQQDEIAFDPITLKQKKTGRKTSGFNQLSYRDRLQYVVLDKFLQNQSAFLKGEMELANAAGKGPFKNVEAFADYLQTSGEVQKYEANFDELRKQAVISTGNVVKEKLPEYLKHNNWFGAGVRSKDFPWLKDKYDKGILDVYQSIMGTGTAISDTNAMAIKEGSKIVGQIGLSIAAGFVIPGGRLTGLSTVARLAVTAGVMATTNVVANQVINRPDYIDPFEAVTDITTQLAFDFGTTFLGGVAMQRFGYGFNSFAQTFSKRGSINRVLSLGDLTLGTVAENFRQSFFMDNPPMGFREQFKSPIGWIGFIFMMFGVKNLNKAERANLKRNYAKLSQYVKENPQIRSMHLDFTDISGKKQFITVGELLDAIDLKKGVKLTKVPALSADVDKIKPVQKIDAHTQRVHDNAALGDGERPAALEKQLQEEGLLGSAETLKKLSAKQKTGINVVHDLSTKSLDEIEAVYQDRSNYEGEGAARKLTTDARKKIQDIIKNNNLDDPRPAVLQHTIAQMQTKKKLLQDIYNFNKKQAHYLVKSGGVGHAEGKSFVKSADADLTSVANMLDNADNQFTLLLGKNFDVKKVEGMIVAIKKKIAQIDKNFDELNKEIQQMRRDPVTKKRGSEQEEWNTKIQDLENERLDLQRRRTDIFDRYKTKVGDYRDYLSRTAIQKADELLKKKTTIALLDRFVDLDEKNSSQLSTAIKEIEALELEIKKLDDLCFGSKLEAGLTDTDSYTASTVRDRKRQLDQKKQDLANKKRELIEARNKKVKKEKAIGEAKQAADAVDTKIKVLEKKKDKLTDTDITDLETDINKLERKHSAVSREEVGGRSKKATLEERIEAQKKKLVELRKTREAAKFKKKYDDELYDEYNDINRNFGNRTVVPDSRIETLERKIDNFERDNIARLDAEYSPGKTYKHHIAEMKKELADIKISRKNAGIAEVESDMDRALADIDHFVATQLDPTITNPSTLDLLAAKNRLALAKAELDRLKDQIKKDDILDAIHPSSGKKRKEHLLDQDQKLKDAELKIARQELHDDTASVYAAITTLETQYRDPAKVQADSFGAANDRIGKLETELRSRGLLKERVDPNDSTSPTYEQYIQNLKDRTKTAKLEYDKFTTNKLISNGAGDGIDDVFNDYNANPGRADITSDRLSDLDRQLNNLESEIKRNGLVDQIRSGSETYGEYVRRMRGELLKLKQKVRLAKGVSKITNSSNDGIDNLQSIYNRDKDRASVEGVEALEKDLDSLEKEMRDDLDQTIPGSHETYREYIARKKTELVDLKKAIKEHHANKSAIAVRDALRRYEEAVENAGMFLDENEILEINARKLALDRAMTDAEKKGGKEKITPEEAARIDTVNKRHDAVTSAKIDATQISRDVDPVLQEYADNILLRGGDVDPARFEDMIKLQFARLLHGLTGRTRRTKILEMISDAYVLDTLLRQGYFKNLKPEQVKLLLERNARIIQIMERYKKSVRIEYDRGDPARLIDPSYTESRSSRLRVYDLTIQEYWDGVRFFAPYSDIQAKYKNSSNATIKKFGEELGSRFLKGTLGGGTDPEKARSEFEKTFEEAYKQLGTKKSTPGEKGSSIDTLDIFFAAADTEILSLVRRAGPIIGKMLEGLYRLVKTAITNERFGTVVTTTYGYLNGGILHATMNWFISNPLFSRRYLRRGLFVIEQLLIGSVTGAIQEHKEQNKVDTYLESKHLKNDYDHYLAPEIVDGNKEAQKIKKRVDTRLGDENPKNDESVTLELIEYLKYVKFIETLETANTGYDPIFKKYILDMSDFDRKRFVRNHTEQELLDPDKIQSTVANELRQEYIGKRGSEIPSRILHADGIQEKFLNKAKALVKTRNINGDKTYREVITSDPWIEDFIDESTYKQILLSDVHGAILPEASQNADERVTTIIEPKIDALPGCPESIRTILEDLVDQAGDPSEEFEYEGRVMSGNNKTPRKSS